MGNSWVKPGPDLHGVRSRCSPALFSIRGCQDNRRSLDIAARVGSSMAFSGAWASACFLLPAGSCQEHAWTRRPSGISRITLAAGSSSAIVVAMGSSEHSQRRDYSIRSGNASFLPLIVLVLGKRFAAPKRCPAGLDSRKKVDGEYGKSAGNMA